MPAKKSKPTKNAVVKADPKKTVAYWVEEVSDCWQAAALSIIATGEALVKAKKCLGDRKGAWDELCDEVPFSPATVSKLMKIANDRRLTKLSHVKVLPSSWGTLYELTKLDDKAFKTAMDKGLINPDMERSEVEKLLGKSKPKIDKHAEDAEVVGEDEPTEDEGDEFVEEEEENEPEAKPTKHDTGHVQPKRTRAENQIDLVMESVASLQTRVGELEDKLENDDALKQALSAKAGRDFLKEAQALQLLLARLVKTYLKGA
jgi:hypothetical protein